jgi:hypothetical protein
MAERSITMIELRKTYKNALILGATLVASSAALATLGNLLGF